MTTGEKICSFATKKNDSLQAKEARGNSSFSLALNVTHKPDQIASVHPVVHNGWKALICRQEQPAPGKERL